MKGPLKTLPFSCYPGTLIPRMSSSFVDCKPHSLLLAETTGGSCNALDEGKPWPNACNKHCGHQFPSQSSQSFGHAIVDHFIHQLISIGTPGFTWHQDCHVSFASQSGHTHVTGIFPSLLVMFHLQVSTVQQKHRQVKSQAFGFSSKNRSKHNASQ